MPTLPRAILLARPLVAIILTIMFWRCVQASDPMPYWSGDAFSVANPPVAILPTLSFSLSILSIVAGCLLLAMHRLGILAIVCTGLAYSTLGSTPGGAGMQDLLLGADWLAAIVGAVGVAAALRIEREAAQRDGQSPDFLLRLTISMLAACVVASFTRGCGQYFVEHARTLASFREDKSAFFASQGWSDGSPMALAFERRISQREASGWFGLSNVFATLMAVTCVFAVMLAVTVQRSGLPANRLSGNRLVGIRVWLALAALAACGVVLAGSKAGYAIVAIGLAAGFILPLAAKRCGPLLATNRRILLAGGVVTMLCCAAVWGGLAVRGAMGEKLGERSLLFRAQYHQAAIVIASNLGASVDVAGRESLPREAATKETLAPVKIEGSLLRGIGPSNFKDRAMLLKPATMPEDVSSPHSLPLDLLFGFGLLAGGVMLAAWFVLASSSIAGLMRAGSTLDEGASSEPQERGTPPGAHAVRDPLWLVPVLCCVVPTAIAASSEAAIATLEQRGVRLLAGLLAAAAAVFVLHALRGVSQRLLHRAIGAASAACVVHLLLELTGVSPGANAWCAMLFAIGASLLVPLAERAPQTFSDGSLPRAGRLAFFPLLMSSVVVGLLALSMLSLRSTIALWEKELAAAYAAAEPVQQLRMRANELAAGKPLDGDTLASLSKDLGIELARPVSPTPQAITASLDALLQRQMPPAIAALARANKFSPKHLPTAQALSRLLTLQADAQQRAGDSQGSSASAAQALACIQTITTQQETASAWSWLAQLHLTHASLLGPTGTLGHQQAALQALIRASVLSPYESQHPKQIVKLAQELAAQGQVPPSLAKAWAMRALQVDDWLALDPLKQMPSSERAAMQAIANK